MKVDGNSTGLWDGIARIIYENTGKTIYKVANGDKTDTFLSLNDCLKLVNYNGFGVCIVIMESPLGGTVYQYGNYADGNWYEHGKTQGFA